MTLGSNEGAVAPSLCEICGRERRAVTLERLEAILAGRETFDSCGVPGSDMCYRLGYERLLASKERAEGPPDLTDWKARAEKAEQDLTHHQKLLNDALDLAEAHAATAMKTESALAEARHKALEEAAQIAEARWYPDWEGLAPALFIADRIRALASGNAPPPQDSQILSSCSPDCTTGPEGGVLHSVEHQYWLAGGSIKTCPVCGEERHGGTCADAALASGNAPEMNQERDRAIALRKLEGEMRCADCGDTWGSGKPGVCPDCGVEALLAPEGESDWTPCFACWLDAHELPSGERPAGPPEAIPDLGVPSARPSEMTPEERAACECIQQGSWTRNIDERIIEELRAAAGGRDVVWREALARSHYDHIDGLHTDPPGHPLYCADCAPLRALLGEGQGNAGDSPPLKAIEVPPAQRPPDPAAPASEEK